ncbi:MAG: leucine-rich repeat domain-containing protein, partial [Oscillospiraceae bacterium]|nr:leucine-rich repeat domain-containing protein [Oscillospiraceae bacterium]
MKKKIVAMLLTIVIVVSLLPGTANASTKVTSGTCGDNVTWDSRTKKIASGGDNVTWSFDESTQTMTISGTGSITTNYDYPGSVSDGNCGLPWQDVRHELKTLVIKEGVTGIGRCAFDSYPALTSVTIPNTVTSIGENAFRATPLTNITIPGSVATIGKGAFQACRSLRSATILDSNNALHIKSFAFSDCWSLNSITLPARTASIEWGAFYDWDMGYTLADVYFSGSEQQWNKIDLEKDDNFILLNANIHFANTSSATPTPPTIPVQPVTPVSYTHLRA